MSDESQGNLLVDTWAYISGGFIALLAWLGRMQVRRIDALEREKATVSALTSLDSRIEEYQSENRKAHNSIYEKLSETRSAVSELVGEIRGRRDGGMKR